MKIKVHSFCALFQATIFRGKVSL